MTGDFGDLWPATGSNQPFVTGQRSWTPGYKPAGDGIVNPIPQRVAKSASAPEVISTASTGVIIGNRNSHVYHLPSGCPSYDKVATKNQITFGSESEAEAAGFRKAGNCR
ncbi:sunset domain-containing protein [Pseudomonas sp. CFBP 13719]|uniref:sunset domain-containing protein n=1 Tax=Pseudomonas sp. CFBP 13719 TaxID=2775303 RepID=UPI00406BF1FB